MTLVRLTKLTVPVGFFGYAIFANLSLLSADVAGPRVESLSNGELTQEIDTLYRENLPHQTPAVGLVGAARYVLLNEGRKGVVPGQSGWLFSSEEFRQASAGSSQFDEVVNYIASVDEHLATLGGKLIVVPLPAKIDLHWAEAGDAEQAAVLGKDYSAFGKALRAANIPVVDAKSSLVLSKQAFLRTDTHWTLDGAQSVADAVARSGFVELGQDSFEVINGDVKEFFGDLVTFVTTEAIAPSVGLLAETVHPYEATLVNDADEGRLVDLFGTADATDIHLVGTSYSANPDWSFAEALKLALSQDVLNYAKEGLGPVAPMVEYIAGLDDEVTTPIVIWEFPVRYLTDPKLLHSLVKEDGDEGA